MTLSRKHFQAVAEILGKNNASGEMVEEFIDYFRTENPLFQGGKFWDAVRKAKTLKAIT
jgi:hypothetical protein